MSIWPLAATALSTWDPINAGTAEERLIDGAGRAVFPSFINIHSHPEHEPLYRGIREEHGLPSMHMTGLTQRSRGCSAAR